MKKIIVGSEGMGGQWGGKVIMYLLKKIGYDEIIYKNIYNCKFIIKSHFLNIEKKWNRTKNRYIYWSGESYIPEKSNKETKSIYMLTTLENMNNYIYIPYVLYSPYLYLERKYNNIDRKYLLAYCNSNHVRERENIFDMFIEKTSINLCHALGNCCGKYPNSRILKASGGWDDKILIDIYKDYKFVIAMENLCKDGYVTEKILNAFYSGAIPIYWGSNNITKFFNKKAFINVSDFNTFEECVNYVVNMTDEQIREMSNEPIYMNDDLINQKDLSNNPYGIDLINLLNDDYNKKNDNKILNEYINIFKKFIE